MSTFLDSLPTFSGKLVVVPRSARATFSVVDRILGIGVRGSMPCRVASLASSLALVQSSSVSLGGNHTTVMLLHFLLSLLIDL